MQVAFRYQSRPICKYRVGNLKFKQQNDNRFSLRSGCVARRQRRGHDRLIEGQVIALHVCRLHHC